MEPKRYTFTVSRVFPIFACAGILVGCDGSEMPDMQTGYTCATERVEGSPQGCWKSFQCQEHNGGSMTTVAEFTADGQVLLDYVSYISNDCSGIIDGDAVPHNDQDQVEYVNVGERVNTFGESIAAMRFTLRFATDEQEGDLAREYIIGPFGRNLDITYTEAEYHYTDEGQLCFSYLFDGELLNNCEGFCIGRTYPFNVTTHGYTASTHLDDSTLLDLVPTPLPQTAQTEECLTLI